MSPHFFSGVGFIFTFRNLRSFPLMSADPWCSASVERALYMVGLLTVGYTFERCAKTTALEVSDFPERALFPSLDWRVYKPSCQKARSAKKAGGVKMQIWLSSLNSPTHTQPRLCLTFPSLETLLHSLQPPTEVPHSLNRVGKESQCSNCFFDRLEASLLF